jgi:hypothetical protein
MSLGPTLVGGVIGAAVGMALHLIVEMTTGIEAPWFAIVIGLATGLGVHQANKSLAGKVSYLRGAITAAIALAAIVGSTPLISKFVSRDGAAAASNQAAAAADEADEADQDADSSAGDATAAAGAEDERLQIVTDRGAASQLARGPAPFNVWQFIYMAVGTFIAYEFGRGTGAHAPAAASTPPEEPVTITDPSN